MLDLPSTQSNSARSQTAPRAACVCTPPGLSAATDHWFESLAVLSSWEPFPSRTCLYLALTLRTSRATGNSWLAGKIHNRMPEEEEFPIGLKSTVIHSPFPLPPTPFYCPFSCSNSQGLHHWALRPFPTPTPSHSPGGERGHICRNSWSWYYSKSALCIRLPM